jgi:regulatory protein
VQAPRPTLSLKARALRHLARREHSRAELERRLTAQLSADRRAAERARRLGSPTLGSSTPDATAEEHPLPRSDEAEAAEQIRRTLDDLVARGLLSDVRTAESLLAAQGRRFGSRRLKQALQAKGLAPELVRSTVQQSLGTEYERALDLWRRRFGQPPADAKEQARQMRFLAGRGFDGDIIRRIVKNAPQADTEG